MKITEITYSRGETRQLQSYEPTNIHMSAKGEVGEGEDITKAFQTIKDIVDGEVATRLTMLSEDKFSKIIYRAAKMVVEKESKPKAVKQEELDF